MYRWKQGHATLYQHFGAHDNKLPVSSQNLVCLKKLKYATKLTRSLKYILYSATGNIGSFLSIVTLHKLSIMELPRHEKRELTASIPHLPSERVILPYLS